jgi:SAM-dependent methyltransferase
LDSWRFPEDVPGWLTLQEGRKLADLARGKRVLEIGSFCGRSTICMAQTAEYVRCIDPMDGRATPHHFDTRKEFLTNLRAYGVENKVAFSCGTTAEIAPWMKNQSWAYDFIFIDGDHSLDAVKTDIQHAVALLAPDGLIAFHDYQSLKDPDVTTAINEFLKDGATLEETCGSLAVVRPTARRVKAKTEKPLVALAMPRRGHWVAFGASQGYHLWPVTGNDGVQVVRLYTATSLLDHCFNRLWCGALNLRQRGITHFAMIHDDVCPPQSWLNLLLDELDWCQADVMSAVVAIKSPDGLTSTAVETADPWFPRRLTLKEVHDLPPTFTDEDVGGELLLNSGLWVCDLRKPWVDNPEPLCFQTLNRLIKDANGDWQAQVRSEDWEFSRAARARGAKLYATRKLAPVHTGEMEYPSDHVWGTQKTDEIYVARNQKLQEVSV